MSDGSASDMSLPMRGSVELLSSIKELELCARTPNQRYRQLGQYQARIDSDLNDWDVDRTSVRRGAIHGPIRRPFSRTEHAAVGRLFDAIQSTLVLRDRSQY